MAAFFWEISMETIFAYSLDNIGTPVLVVEMEAEGLKSGMAGNIDYHKVSKYNDFYYSNSGVVIGWRNLNLWEKHYIWNVIQG